MIILTVIIIIIIIIINIISITYKQQKDKTTHYIFVS